MNKIKLNQVGYFFIGCLCLASFFSYLTMIVPYNKQFYFGLFYVSLNPYSLGTPAVVVELIKYPLLIPSGLLIFIALICFEKAESLLKVK